MRTATELRERHEAWKKALDEEFKEVAAGALDDANAARHLERLQAAHVRQTAWTLAYLEDESTPEDEPWTPHLAIGLVLVSGVLVGLLCKALSYV